jgi:hypothetical protein
MGIEDMALKTLTKEESKQAGPTRSEKEVKIKSHAGLIINIFAALLAFNVWFGGSLSSLIMNNTIKANDLWNFYQAKSVKQTQYEIAAQNTNNPALAKKYAEKAKSYDEGKEGKPALFDTAKKLEADRDYAKKRSPWIGYAGTAYQLSIVLLSASILAVSMPLFWSSFVLCAVGITLMSQGLWLWLPL